MDSCVWWRGDAGTRAAEGFAVRNMETWFRGVGAWLSCLRTEECFSHDNKMKAARQSLTFILVVLFVMNGVYIQLALNVPFRIVQEPHIKCNISEHAERGTDAGVVE